MNIARMIATGVLGGGAAQFVIYTDADNTSTFDPAWTFAVGGGPMTVDWGDGSAQESHATTLSHTYAGAGRKRVVFTCHDWAKLLTFAVDSDICRLSLPDVKKCTGLTQFYAQANQFSGSIPSSFFATSFTRIILYGNQLTGTLPSLAAMTSLTIFRIYDNLLSGSMPSLPASMQEFSCSNNPSMGGALPSFASNSALLTFDIGFCAFTGSLPSLAAAVNMTAFQARSNQLSGTIPDFAPCTKLTSWQAYTNQFTGYTAGSFATQKSLASLLLYTNNLTQTAVDGILADLVTSLSISGRVACTVRLDGVGNSPPSVAGMANRDTLIAAGWTVAVNSPPLILTFGDSITATTSWPEEVKTGYAAGVNTVINLAVSGAKIIAASNNMAEQVDSVYDHDAVYAFILLGTNDTETGAALTTEYEAQVNEIISKNPTATIWGLAILPRTDMTGVADKNTRIQTACTNTGITFVDTSGWIIVAEDTSDGLHLDASGKTKVANAVIALLPA